MTLRNSVCFTGSCCKGVEICCIMTYGNYHTSVTLTFFHGGFIQTRIVYTFVRAHMHINDFHILFIIIFFSSNDLPQIGASICRGSFTKYLYLEICVILDEQNHLSWPNTVQSQYYMQGLCSGCHFLTVASRGTCAAERG